MADETYNLPAPWATPALSPFDNLKMAILGSLITQLLTPLTGRVYLG